MSEIKRKKNESFESFVRRVKKRWQQSGKILQVKKIRYKTKSANKTLRKKSALHRFCYICSYHFYTLYIIRSKIPNNEFTI